MTMLGDKTEKRAKILVIEDSPTQAAVIADIVRQAGHEAVVYNSLPGGIIQILSNENPDLVLLDLKLLDSDGNPIADGFQVCREIKRNRSSVPVIVVSAQGDDESCEWALMQGADAYIQKPFVLEEFRSVLDRVLES